MQASQNVCGHKKNRLADYNNNLNFALSCRETGGRH